MKNGVTFVLTLLGKAGDQTKNVILDVPGARDEAYVKVSGYARGNAATVLYGWLGKGKQYKGLFKVDLVCQQGYTGDGIRPFGPGDVVDVTVTVTNPDEPPIVGSGVVVIGP